MAKNANSFSTLTKFGLICLKVYVNLKYIIPFYPLNNFRSPPFTCFVHPIHTACGKLKPCLYRTTKRQRKFSSLWSTTHQNHIHLHFLALKALINSVAICFSIAPIMHQQNSLQAIDYVWGAVVTVHSNEVVCALMLVTIIARLSFCLVWQQDMKIRGGVLCNLIVLSLLHSRCCLFEKLAICKVLIKSFKTELKKERL